jgi:hypothetical protein
VLIPAQAEASCHLLLHYAEKNIGLALMFLSIHVTGGDLILGQEVAAKKDCLKTKSLYAYIVRG